MTSAVGRPAGPHLGGDREPAAPAAGHDDGAAPARHVSGEIQALLRADEVEDGVDPVSAVGRDHPGHGVGPGEDAVVCPDVRSEVQPCPIDVDGEDASLRRGPQELHGEVAETADAHDHGGRSRLEDPAPVLDRVQSGQARVRQRRGLDGIEAAERHQVAGRDDHLLGHAAVRRDADRAGHDVAAQVVLRLRARRARAAPEELVHRHERPPTGGVDALAVLDHLADDLVPEGHGQLQPATAVAQQAQIRPADAGGEHPQRDLARRGPGGRHVGHLRAPGVGQAVGTHVGGQSRWWVRDSPGGTIAHERYMKRTQLCDREPASGLDRTRRTIRLN